MILLSFHIMNIKKKEKDFDHVGYVFFGLCKLE
jgi:hypothetical protein